MASGLAAEHARIGAAIHERIPKASTEADYIALRLDGASWMFDLYARMYALATTFETLEEHTRALETLAQGYVEAGMRHNGSLNARTLRSELDIRMKQRKFHWISKLHQVAGAREPTAAAPQDPQSLPSATPSAPSRPPTRAETVPQRAEGRVPEATSRRALVDACIQEAALRTGKRITRTDFWKAAGYKTRTEFERWQRNDPKTTKAAAEAFERVLRNKIHPN